MPIESRAYLTSEPPKATENLEHQTVFLPFGGMIAMFCSSKEENILRMVNDKSRPDGKPFVTTASIDYIEMLLEHSGISSAIKSPLKDKIGLLLRKTSEIKHPLGILLPYNENSNLPSQLVGKGLVSVNNQKYNTFGFMVSPDKNYFEVAKSFDQHIFPGTSANKSGDERANGSGHHRLAGVLAHFGSQECTIFVAQGFREGQGPSTTTAFINEKGEVYLSRKGSTSSEDFQKLVFESDLNYIGEVDGGARVIKPYDYSGTKGGELTLFMLNRIFQVKTTITGGFYITESEMKIIQALVPPPKLK